MPKYIKCPRCDLNYIEEDKELCEVCLAERQGRHLRFADIDEFGSDDSEATKLCPICGENYISLTESCCEDCRDKNILADDEFESDVEQDDEWRKYLDEDIRELALEDEIEESIDESIDEEFEDELLEEELDEFNEENIDILDEDEDDYDDDEDEDEDDFEDDF